LLLADVLFVEPEDGSIMFLRNAGELLLDYMAPLVPCRGCVAEKRELRRMRGSRSLGGNNRRMEIIA
jgi:hypothetical protein